MMIENSKVYEPYSYTKSHLKENYAHPSYLDISYRVSTEIDTNFQTDENYQKIFLESVGTAQI